MTDEGLDAELAALLERRLAGLGAEDTGIKATTGTDGLPLSPGQQQLWFLHQLDPASVAYNSAISLRLRGSVNLEALRAALDGLVARHEPLRTTFATVDGQATQVINPAGPADLRIVSADEDSVLRDAMSVPFDLAAGPPFRALMVRTSDTESTLLLCMHHIAGDGWSKGVIASELGELYAAAVEGRRPALPELPVRYADFAAWQRDQDTDGQLSYWREQLADVPVLDLPTDRPRPSVRSTAGALYEFRVPAPVVQGLNELARAQGSTLFAGLLAACQVLFSRYCRQRDIALGTVVTGRNRREVEGLVGYFVNTLVLRSNVQPETSFADFMDEVTGTVLDAFAHQDVPFDRVVDALSIRRTQDRTPLAQVMVVLQNALGQAITLPGLSVEEVRPPCLSSAFDITVEFTETASGELAGSLEYDTALFDESTMDRLARHLVVLLTDAVANPAQAVADLSMMDDEERALVTEQWAVHQVDFPADKCVHELIGASDKVAVVGDGVELTYAELDARANQVANLLIANGVGVGTFVAVRLPRGVDLVVALLGVLKAGAAYVPLDPDYPADRLAFMIADAEASVCLTEASLVDAAAFSTDAPSVDVKPSDAAYVIYTSGSTGRPKGTIVEHRSITRLVCNADYVALREDDVVAQGADATFDAATFEIWGPLVAGARMVVIDKLTLLDPPALAAALAEHAVTTLWLTVSVFNQVVAVDPAAFRGLRHVIFGGEAANPARVAQVLAAGPPQRLVNGYGPTETTTFATSHLVENSDGQASIPIGRPIVNTAVYVLDERLTPVPVGVPGELFVAGPGVSRGYLNRPELTAERFLDNPFGPAGWDRLYRTGDLVRWLPDGTIEYSGRADQQVKVRGYRIEPAEIELVLEQHPDVRSAAVVVRQDGDRKRLVGYVTGSASGLREFVASRLPDHLVPTAFVVLDEFPLTPSGKLDRLALPAPDTTVDSGHVEPRTENERILADVWAEVLGVERVGVTDNFFEVGGDSILSIQLVAKARQAGLVLSAKDIFARQTVAELAVVAGQDVTPVIDSGPVSGEVVLTPVQRWFFENHTEQPWHFNQSVLLTLRPDVNENALRGALQSLVDHHDALRMRFTRTDEGWQQYNLAQVELMVERHECDADAMRDIAVAGQANLDLTDGPVFRAILFDLGTRKRLLLIAHHLVVDGVSWRILLDDLDRAYRQQPFGPRTTSYQQWAAGLAEVSFADELEYWTRVESVPAEPFPLDLLGGVNTVDTVRDVRVALPETVTSQLLHEAPAAYRTQVNDLLLTALGPVLARHTGDDRVRIDLEGHGREDLVAHADLSRTVGWFTSIFPFVLDARTGRSIGERILQTKEELRAIPHKGVSYGALRYFAGAELTAHPEISFNYLGQWDGTTAATEVYDRVEFDYGVDHGPRDRRPHMLDIVAEVIDGRLEFCLYFSTHLHEESTVRRLADEIVAAVTDVVEHCLTPGYGGASPSDFPLAGLTQSEVDRIASRDVVDIYPLTPMQSGMLFHALAEPGSGVYLDHVSFVLDGVEDPAALGRAWQRVLDTTPALRTSLVWEGLAKPMQVVRTGVELDIRYLDWEADSPERLRKLLASERAAGIDLAKPPLTRLTLVKVGPESVRVVWTFHHILIDGWSTSHILADLFAYYRSRSVATRRPFRDYVEWLGGQDNAEDYWRARLDGLRAATQLPYDRQPGPGHQSESAGQIRLSLDAGDLSAVARRHRVTVNTILQGAWALLLARYSASSKVCFGATVSGRPSNLSGADEMVGNFLNTLPVVVDVRSDEDLVSMLTELQEQQSEARRFEHVALGTITACSKLPKGEALFDSIVVFENYPGNAAAEYGLTVRDVSAVDTTSYALDLTAHLTEGRLDLALSYDTELFDAERIESIGQHLVTLLQDIVADPTRPLGELNMLPEAERDRLLASKTVPFEESTLHELIAAQAARTPNAPALQFESTVLSYAELMRRADELAGRIAARGVQPDTLVGICLERGIDMVVSVLAVLKAGGAYVPLDPGLPADRLAYMVSDSQAKFVVTRTSLRVPGDTLCIDEPSTETAPVTKAGPDNLAYVIYTSGSTGKPKGVMVTHRNVCHGAAAWNDVYQLAGNSTRQISCASPSFDVFVSDMAHALCWGGTLVVAPADVVTDPALLLDLIERSAPADLETVPSLINAVLDEVERRGGTLPPMRVLAIGSDNWRTQDCQRLLDKVAPGTKVVNTYGVTEATVESAVYAVHTLPGTASVPIGRPIPNVRAYVLDASMRPVGVGVTGELFLGGPGVARGYLNRPQLTAERFIEFGDERLYRTGDLARFLPSGDIEFLGRGDDQVKVRGIRVELGEIESALIRHPDVAAAAVTLHDGRLVGYVVPAHGRPPANDDLRAHLEALLPRHIVPGSYLVIDEIPLNPNGKVDRRALPAPGPAMPASAGHVPPRDPVEAALARVWAEVLRVGQVGVHDNFFDLGGDSIVSIQLVSRARQEGLQVTSKDIFAHQTVAELAAAVAGRQVDAVGQPSEPVTGRVPLTPIQRAFFSQHTVKPAHYNMSVLIELGGTPDEDALRRTLDALVTHHDALRMRFSSTYRRWRQDNGAAGEGWPFKRGTSADIEKAQASLDLTDGPLVRAVLVDNQLFLTAHHLVMDAVSWQVLVSDLETGYQQAVAGKPVDFGPKTTSFRQWALKLSEHTVAGGFDDELDYWIEATDGVDTQLPVDRVGQATVGSARSVRVSLTAAETTALLRDVPAAYRTQVNDVLLAALGRTLADWTGRERVRIDLEGHGREEIFPDVRLDRTVGWFTSSFPVVLAAESTVDWATEIKSAKEVLRAVPRRGIGYGALRYLSSPDSPAEILAEMPAAQVGFNYLGQWSDEPEAQGLVRATQLGYGTEQAADEKLEYLLDIVACVRDGELQVDLYYSTEIHDERTIAGLGEKFLAGLRAATRHCQTAGGGATPSDFPLARLDQATVDRLVAGGPVDDIYPLTPMQNGLLFHSLTEDSDGVYLGQLSFVVDGVRDIDVLAQAWQEVVDRTPILRSAIVWENVPDALQIVRSDVRVPIERLDRLAEADLERLLEADRRAGMDLTVAPLMRLKLIDEGAGAVRVVWTSHHLLLDGWSSADLVAEVLETYLRLSGHDRPLPAERRPFRDYVEWLAGQDIQDAMGYWSDQLAGFTEPTPLPVDRSAERVGSDQSVRFELSTETSTALHQLARKHRLTVNTIAQGAWALLLSRYAGRTDVCFGSTVSGRPADLPGVESIVGIFINNLPVRVRCEGERDLIGWLADLQRSQVDARQYDYVSLAQVRGWSEVAGGVNLFDSYLVFENYPLDESVGAEFGLSIRDVRSLEPTSYGLVLAAFTGERLAFRLAYEPGLFERATITRMMDDLESLLTGISQQPERTLAELPVLSEKHLDQVLRASNDTTVELGDDRPVHELFADQAMKTPDAVAVVSGAERLTFAGLDAEANRLAHLLVEHGAGPEAVVAVCMDRGTALVTSILAVLKAGAVYAPIDPTYPAERLAFLLDDTKASIVLTHSTIDLPETKAVVIPLDQQDLTGRPAGALSRPVTMDSAAYVIYTSGSTGQPKGVVVEHGSLANLYDSHRRTVFGPVTNGEAIKVAHLAPASFDAAWNPVLWMVNGHELHIVADDTRRDAEALVDYITATGIGFFQATPTMARQLVAAGLLERATALGGFALGGEKIGVELWNAIARTDMVCFNFYGPTESTVDALVQRIEGSREVIGRPIQNIRAYVLDDSLAVLPVGATGELVLAGKGLARGYLGRPELTEQSFPQFAGERVYRTGDLVRRLADGTIEFVGRADHQVKLRGYRIELAEIAAVLTGHPDVADAVVTVHGEQDDQRLVGYVQSADVDQRALTDFVRGRLPEYMVPAAIVVLPEFPLTSSGKIDRLALPEPDQTSGAAEWVEPRTGTEQALAAIWSEVLGVPRVGAHDDFFALGGHSIVSLKVISKVRKTFGVRLSFRDLLDKPTVAELADQIEETLLAALEAEAAQAANAE